MVFFFLSSMSIINGELFNVLVLKSHNELNGLSLIEIMKVIDKLFMKIHLIFNESEKKRIENNEYKIKLNKLNIEIQKQSILNNESTYLNIPNFFN